MRIRYEHLALLFLLILTTCLSCNKEDDVNEHIEHAKTENREDAEALNEQLHSRMVKSSISLLKDPKWTVRRVAALQLGQIGDTRATEPLIEALKDKELEVRCSVVSALGQIGDTRATEPLIEALKDKELPVRRAAAKALGQVGDVRAVEWLTLTLKYDSMEASEVASEALAAIGTPAVDALVSALEQKDTWVQLHAGLALCEIGDARGTKPLTVLLWEGSMSDEQFEKVVTTLGRSGIEQAFIPVKGGVKV